MYSSHHHHHNMYHPNGNLQRVLEEAENLSVRIDRIYGRITTRNNDNDSDDDEALRSTTIAAAAAVTAPTPSPYDGGSVLSSNFSYHKPLRPLTAYNIFFQLQRERILHRISGDNNNDDNDEKLIPFTIQDMERVVRDRDRLWAGGIVNDAAAAAATLSSSTKKKRKNNPIIVPTFGELSHQIGIEWKKLDHDTKELFRNFAKQIKITWMKRNNTNYITTATTVTIPNQHISCNLLPISEHSSLSSSLQQQRYGRILDDASSMADRITSLSEFHSSSSSMSSSPTQNGNVETINSWPLGNIASVITPTSLSSQLPQTITDHHWSEFPQTTSGLMDSNNHTIRCDERQDLQQQQQQWQNYEMMMKLRRRHQYQKQVMMLRQRAKMIAYQSSLWQKYRCDRMSRRMTQYDDNDDDLSFVMMPHHYLMVEDDNHDDFPLATTATKNHEAQHPYRPQITPTTSGYDHHHIDDVIEYDDDSIFDAMLMPVSFEENQNAMLLLSSSDDCSPHAIEAEGDRSEDYDEEILHNLIWS